MSNPAFTYGNVLLLYCNYNKKNNNVFYSEDLDKERDRELHKTDNKSGLPDHIIERIDLGIKTFNIIMNSKPDKFNSSIIVIAENDDAEIIKERLISSGISKQYIEYDNVSKTVDTALSNCLSKIKKLSNPPAIYFIGSVWQKEVYDSIVISKFKDLKITFEGSLDHRPFDIIRKEKATEEPKKGSTYYKHKLTDKAIDALLNYIFSNKRK